MQPSGFRGVFRIDAEARAVYAEGAGIARIVPRAVAVPADPDDVVALVRWAADARAPLTPRGSASSMANGALGDGVVVDLGVLRDHPSYAALHQVIRCGPGVTRAELDAEARRNGLQFPVDPSSGAFCTIGGMLATNAAGARTLRYGATREWVLAADCVFADGSRAWLRSESPETLPAHIAGRLAAIPRFEERLRAVRAPHTRKNSSGYALLEYARSRNPLDLLIGSEGTLALIVGVEVALAPLPPAAAALLAGFDTLEGSAIGARVALEARASACELLDRTFLEIAARGGARLLPAETEAALLIELEGTEEQVRASANALDRALRRVGATAVHVGLDAESADTLWALRHAASPTLARLDPSLKSMQVVEDGAVPPDALPAYVRGVRAALSKHALRGVLFGHAGDAHVHVNALVDVSTPTWQVQLRALYDDVSNLTRALGGTLAGEHGDGRLRAPRLEQTWGADAVALMREVKSAFDPLGILNPGVKLPLPGQQPWGDVRYDPALPPLPPRAARALARVERDRAWQQHRLEMLAREH